MPNPFEVLAAAVRILNACGVPHMLGGSMASSLHGTVRYTEDIDLVIDLPADQLDSLAEALGPEFYVSREAMREAVRERRSFNAIHLDSVIKIDCFVLGRDSFDREQFARREPITTGLPGDPSIMVSTAEDMILRKLRWFRAGGESSERQWRDVIGILKARRGQLDEPHMRQWAAHLDVSDLLERAATEAAGSS